jgi:uncharacterized alpha-E superfamily protein
MLSRVADSLYWMSRYVERAENTARMLDVTMSMMIDTGGIGPDTRWLRLVHALGRPTGLEWNGNAELMAHRLIFEAHSRASITSCIDSARENARQVREEISSEQWQRLNRMYHQIHSHEAQQLFEVNISDVLTMVLDGIYLFDGVSDGTMIRRQGCQFMRLGRYLERAYATATILEVHQKELFDSYLDESSISNQPELVGLLRSCTSFEAYCHVYTAEITPGRVLEFLLLNSEFPHSIHYCVDGVRSAIEAVQLTGGRQAPEQLTAGIGRLHAMLGYSTIEEILRGDTLHFLNSIRKQCLQIHELIYRNYVHYSIQSALAG